MTDGTEWEGAHWDASGAYKIRMPDGDMISTDEPLTEAFVKRAAREKGIRKFDVESLDGRTLTPADFPYSGSVVMTEQNLAA
jgi:hypothetical protein